MKAFSVYLGTDSDGDTAVIVKFTAQGLALIESFPSEMNPFHQDDCYNGNPTFEEYQDKDKISFDYDGESWRIIMTPFAPYYDDPQEIDCDIFFSDVINGIGKWCQNGIVVNWRCSQKFDGSYEFDILT